MTVAWLLFSRIQAAGLIPLKVEGCIQISEFVKVLCNSCAVAHDFLEVLAGNFNAGDSVMVPHPDLPDVQFLEITFC